MALAQAANTGGGSGTAFLVSAGIVYEIIAANCSSPQTTELNAKSRAGTLMKWVHLGLGQSVIFVAAAATFDRAHRLPIVIGGSVAAILMYGLYGHAKMAGLASGAPETETHNAPGALWGRG